MWINHNSSQYSHTFTQSTLHTIHKVKPKTLTHPCTEGTGPPEKKGNKTHCHFDQETLSTDSIKIKHKWAEPNNQENETFDQKIKEKEAICSQTCPFLEFSLSAPQLLANY